jgi:hypothetical protein
MFYLRAEVSRPFLFLGPWASEQKPRPDDTLPGRGRRSGRPGVLAVPATQCGGGSGVPRRKRTPVRHIWAGGSEVGTTWVNGRNEERRPAHSMRKNPTEFRGPRPKETPTRGDIWPGPRKLGRRRGLGAVCEGIAVPPIQCGRPASVPRSAILRQRKPDQVRKAPGRGRGEGRPVSCQAVPPTQRGRGSGVPPTRWFSCRAAIPMGIRGGRKENHGSLLRSEVSQS